MNSILVSSFSFLAVLLSVAWTMETSGIAAAESILPPTTGNKEERLIVSSSASLLLNNATVEAWPCAYGQVIYDGLSIPKDEVAEEPYSIGALLNICIAPDDASHAKGVRIKELLGFEWWMTEDRRDDASSISIRQPAVVDGELAPERLSTVSAVALIEEKTMHNLPYRKTMHKLPSSTDEQICRGGVDGCVISSILNGTFYETLGRRENLPARPGNLWPLTAGVVHGTGKAALELVSGDGRAVNNDEEALVVDFAVRVVLRSLCDAEERAYHQCFAMNEYGECQDCPWMIFEDGKETFGVDLGGKNTSVDLNKRYSEVIFDHPVESKTCQAINNQICPVLRCCCQAETEAWQTCFAKEHVARDFLWEDAQKRCKVDCLPDSSLSTTSLSTTSKVLLVGIPTVLLVLYVAYVCLLRRCITENEESEDSGTYHFGDIADCEEQSDSSEHDEGAGSKIQHRASQNEESEDGNTESSSDLSEREEYSHSTDHEEGAGSKNETDQTTPEPLPISQEA